jgi:hypothetical protein
MNSSSLKEAKIIMATLIKFQNKVQITNIKEV